MTGDDLNKWCARLGLSFPKAATALGIGRSTLFRYRLGLVEIPLAIELACAELERRYIS